MRRGDFEGKRVHVVEEGNLARGVWTPLQHPAGWSVLSARENRAVSYQPGRDCSFLEYSLFVDKQVTAG